MMKKILAVILSCVTLLGMMNAVVFAEENVTNLIPEKSSTFETGTSSWMPFAGGTIATVNNPNGEGKVLEYTVNEDKSKTWASPALDLRPIIQKNGESGTYYLYIMFYAETDVTLQVTIRTQNQNMSLAQTAGNDYPRLGTEVGTAGEWTLFSCEFEVEDDDLTVSEGAWNLCFDGLTRCCEKLYIDNVILSTEEADIELPDDGIELPAKTEVTRSDETLIGTIRWDAFTKSTVGGTDPASQVAKVLSPAKYHSQAPFFANVESDGTVSFPEYTVETWEKEADYAVQGGLDYFAYLWYETSDAMSQPRKMHLQSAKKDTVKMCGILEKLRSGKTMTELFDAMGQSCYLRVSNRPVVFVYDADKWDDKDIEKLRKSAVKAGINESLYLVGMFSSANKISEVGKKDVDAISWYSVGASKKDMTFAELAASNMDALTKANAVASGVGMDVIPAFTTGRDSRARIETGVSWVAGDPNAKEDKDKPYGNTYSFQPTMDEMKKQITDVLSFVKNNTDTAKCNLVCSYGWNEHEEGGWLCPTLTVDENGVPVKDENGNVKANTERIEALKEAIDAFKSGKTEVSATDAPAGATNAPAETPVPTDSAEEKGGFNALYVIIPVAAVVVIGGGVAVFFVIKKRKEK